MDSRGMQSKQWLSDDEKNNAHHVSVRKSSTLVLKVNFRARKEKLTAKQNLVELFSGKVLREFSRLKSFHALRAAFSTEMKKIKKILQEEIEVFY